MTASKIVLAAASTAGGGAGLDVDEVYSTFVYDGNSSTQAITNGIDLDGEGGFVWLKIRSHTTSSQLYDTERGVTKYLISNSDSGELTYGSGLTAFNSNGFTLSSGSAVNGSTRTYASWTFRKAPKFFDVVTYTGNGVAGRTVSHNLGSTPGMMLVKKTNASDEWYVFHRSVGATKTGYLNTTSAFSTNSAVWNNTAPNSTTFTVGTVNGTNQDGQSYVAYLFAHNDGDGEFGPDADQDIIKCGSFTASSSKTASVDLGFEPQWLMIKSSSVAEEWIILDVMRGLRQNQSDFALFANSNIAEETGKNYVNLRPTGFDIEDNVTGSADYIYMAIRRGSLAEPENVTDVFKLVQQSGSDPQYTSNFVVDMAVNKAASNNTIWYHRSRGGKKLLINSTAIEASGTDAVWDYMDGVDMTNNTSWYGYMWKRAPKYMEEVHYVGNGTSGRTVTHNLGVVPEMMWIKNRDQTLGTICYHSGIGNTNALFMHTNVDLAAATAAYWNNTSPTNSVFTVGNSSATNNNNRKYVCNLFASLDGISKVGSYTGNGSASQDIDCGFSNGSAFILIKDTLSNTEWFVFGHGGINSGNDPYFQWDQDYAEGSRDSVDPLSSGFTVTNDVNTTLNTSGKEYIFYAIAA